MGEIRVEPGKRWNTSVCVTVIAPYVFTDREHWYWVKLDKRECRVLAYDLLRVAEDLAEVEDT